MRMSTRILFLLAVAALACRASSVAANDAAYIREHYTKYEYRIPMRDDVKLFTSVYVPKDKSRAYPIILTRTPYSVRPYGLDDYLDSPRKQHRRYFQEGYIVAYQDVRGRYMSEGSFVHVRPYLPNKTGNGDVDETTDTYDTVDWLVKNVPGNNGRVGISGISYPGFYTSMGAIDAHPAIKAVSPQAPVSNWMGGGDDWFHNGAFLVSHAFDFLVRFGWPRPEPKSEPDPSFDHVTPDGYRFFLEMGPLPGADRYMRKEAREVAFWYDLMSHGKLDDFWHARNILPHLKDIQPAVMVVGGWFDTENLYGALETYAAIETQSPGAVNTLVMGPWSHGYWSRNDGQRLGEIDFGSKTADYYTEHVEVPFFNHYLTGASEPDIPEALMFDTGANAWGRFERWPPQEVTPHRVFLRANGELSFQGPAASEATYDEYVSDPSKPVPYTAEIVHWYNRAFMLEDQRFAAKRPDVLVYQTPPLEEDITIAGPIAVSFFVSTSGTDSDWVVKVIDVFPDDTPDPDPNPREIKLGGYQMLVRGDVLRGKFRNSLAEPEPFVPNEVAQIDFELSDVLHTLQKNHRLMVQVQSSWFPMIDRNPQTFVDIYHAKERVFHKATQRVYRDARHPSHVSFGALRRPDAGALPSQ